MHNSINIDIGGTFTDCYVVHNSRIAYGKAPTTRYNLSRGLLNAIEKCGQDLGLSPEKILEETQIVKYATTLAMNALLERKGARCALVGTKGFGDILQIGNQDRPKLFDLEIKKFDLLYEESIEVDERLRIIRPDEDPDIGAQVVESITGDRVEVLKKPNLDDLRPRLEKVLMRIKNAGGDAVTHHPPPPKRGTMRNLLLKK